MKDSCNSPHIKVLFYNKRYSEISKRLHIKQLLFYTGDLYVFEVLLSVLFLFVLDASWCCHGAIHHLNSSAAI